MRTAVLLTSCFLLSACGGGTGSTDGDPPDTGTISIVAGEAQSASPGQAVSNPLIVVVRNLGGVAIPGVRVQFVVTAGGGHIARTSATTGADGKADAGLWTLGASGNQTLEARVGTLTPARFHGSLVIASVEKTIGSSGGTLEITDPTTTLNGTQLTIPAGTFSSPGSWRLSVEGTSIPGLPTGFTAIGPALRIDNDGLRGNRLMTLRVPVEQQSGAVTVLIASDFAGTRFELLPIIATDNNSVTVGMTHFAGGRMLGPGLGATPSGASFNGSAASAVFLGGRMQQVSILLDALGFDQKLLEYVANGWTAQDKGTYQYPNGHGPSIPIMSILARVRNIPLGSSIRVVEPFGGLADTAAQAALALATANFQLSLPSFRPVLGDLANAFAALTPPARDQLTTLNLRAGMLTSRLPQLLVFGEQLSTSGDFGKMSFADMFGISASGFWFTTPYAPTTALEMSLAPSGFTSRLSKRILDGAPFQAQAILPLGGSFILPIEGYNDILTQMKTALSAGSVQRNTLNHSLAAAAHFPDILVQLRSTATAPWIAVFDTLFIRDETAEVRTSCALCPGALSLFSEPAQQSIELGTVAGPSQFRAPRSITPTPAIVGVGGSLTFGNLQAAGLLNQLGFTPLIATVIATLEGDVAGVAGNLRRAFLSLHLPVVYAPFEVQVPSTDLSPGVDVAFAAAVKHPPPGGWVVDWDWNDGSPIERISDQQSAKHKFTAPATRTVRATLRTNPSLPGGSIPLAVFTKTVTIAYTQYAWRFTSASSTSIQLPPGGIGDDDTDDPLIQSAINGYIANLHNAPANWLFYLYNTGVCKSLVLEQFQPGHFEPIFDPTFGGPLRGLFASNCDLAPDYVGSLTFGPLGAGVLNGSLTDIPQDESFVLPGGSITSTMNGPVLSGSFTWRVRYSTGIALYTFNFQASQVLP